jgi:predicted Zn finger-like uncharacterized protein
MKFTCDSCGAQYMISDDKVGPNGVKVRCKKCQHVVLVRRPADAAPAVAPAPTASAAEGSGLDAELGQAFDSMLGGAPPAAAAPSPDLQSTQLMSEEDAARIAAAAPAGGTNAASDWYVAIGESQVGPLPLPEVKRKWEAGEVGPDSLVWKPGMSDWQALSSVGDLAAALAPVPRAGRSRAAAAREQVAARAAAPAAPAEEPSWKPSGASALASLASEEMAARAPEARPTAARPAGGGARSLVEQMNLPDAGGVDPTGAIPLAIKGIDSTPAAQRRRTSVARGAAQVRQRRSAVRWIASTLVLVVVAGGGAAAFAFRDRLLGAFRAEPGEAAPGAEAAAPAAVPPTPVAPPAAASPKAPVPARAPTAVATAPAAPAPKAPEPKASEPVAKPRPAPTRVAAAEPARAAPRTEPRAEARPPAPAPAPAATSKKKPDPLLDFDSGGGDSALDEALGGTPSGRSVYVPPRPGSDLPAQLSASQINESVLTQVEALRRCVSDQKARDPDATGTLKMRWIITGEGGVRDVKCLSPEYASGPFATCITGVVRATRFPRSATRGQEVTFPFTF